MSVTRDLAFGEGWLASTAQFLKLQGSPLDAAVTVEELRAFHYPDRAWPRVSERHVEYAKAGPDRRPLRALMCLPDPGPTLAPGVVLIHGGGWANGCPMMHRLLALTLAELGFVATSIQYRLLGEAKWPAALEDAKCAVRWLKSNRDEFHVDPRRVAVMGSSAGGHLAAMVALSPGHFEGKDGYQAESSEVQAAVLVSPITDMNVPGGHPGSRFCVEQFLGDCTDDLVRSASPITYVSASSPPVLTLAGSADRAAPLPMIEDFHHALDAHGVPNRLEVCEGREHAFHTYGEGWRWVTDRMVEFVHTRLCTESRSPVSVEQPAGSRKL